MHRLQHIFSPSTLLVAGAFAAALFGCDAEVYDGSIIGKDSKELYLLQGILEVQLVVGPGQVPPSTLEVVFPALPNEGAPARAVTLELKNDRGDYIYTAFDYLPPNVDPELTDSPFVYHPDQWDEVKLRFPSGFGQVVGLRFTKYVSTTDKDSLVEEVSSDARWSFYDFVISCDIAATNVPRLKGTDYTRAPTDHLDVDATLTCNAGSALPASVASASDTIDMTGMIAQRRRSITETVAGKPFRELPLILRKVADDIGQSTTMMKYDNTYPSGACSTVMGYPQLNYTYDFETDLFRREPGDHYEYSTQTKRVWNKDKIYPYPDGTLLAGWKNAIDNGRALARVNFSVSKGLGRFALDALPFEKVEPDMAGNWRGTGADYTPKAGDMFWRLDKCYHDNNLRHAMTLARAPEFVAGKFRIPIWDGAVLFAIRDRDGQSLLNRKFPALDTDIKGDPINCVTSGETNVTYCAAEGDSDLRCPIDSSPNEFRFDYYVGETYNFKEIAVANNADPAANGWQAIGSDLYITPVDETLQGLVGLKKNPKQAELRFADFNGDGRDDMYWRNSSARWFVSYAPEFDGWERVGASSSTVLECGSDASCGDKYPLFFGDFGSPGKTGAPDGKTDVMRLRRSGTILKLDVSYNDDDASPRFARWNTVETFAPFGGASLKSHADNIVAGDFDGDGRADIFFRDPADATWKIYFLNNDTWRTVKTNVPQALSHYQFADFDADGKMDVIKKHSSNDRWLRSELTSTRSGWKMSSWRYIRDSAYFVDTTPIQNARFGNFDGNETLDFFKVSSSGEWVIRYDFSSTRTAVVHEAALSVEQLLFASVGAADQLTDVIAFRALGAD